MRVQQLIDMTAPVLIDHLLSLDKNSNDDHFEFWLGLGVLTASRLRPARDERDVYDDLWATAYGEDQSQNWDQARAILQQIRTQLS